MCKPLLHTPVPAGQQAGWQVHKRIRARKNIKSAGEHSDRIYVLCEGWAFRFVQLPDGRKQILAILVPGDVITPTRVFEETIWFSVQALTDARCCGYPRSAVRAKLDSDPALLDAWAKLLVAERRRDLELLIDLGSRTADERIAHLILQLKRRLDLRGLATESSLLFPLPQRFIAAATGLTPEHVSRVMGRFRHAGIIDGANGIVSITDLPKLQRIGHLNF